MKPLLCAAARSKPSVASLCIPFNFPTLRTKARFCAIPSTSGTATEVTAFSVITDYQNGVKYPLADFNITPDVAIVDPDLAETIEAFSNSVSLQKVRLSKAALETVSILVALSIVIIFSFNPP